MRFLREAHNVVFLFLICWILYFRQMPEYQIFDENLVPIHLEIAIVVM